MEECPELPIMAWEFVRPSPNPITGAVPGSTKAAGVEARGITAFTMEAPVGGGRLGRIGFCFLLRSIQFRIFMGLQEAPLAGGIGAMPIRITILM